MNGARAKLWRGFGRGIGLGAAACMTIAACGVVPGPTAEPMIELGAGITAPASDLRPTDRCMLDAGFVAVDVSAGRSGTNARYGLSWAKETFYTWEKGNAAVAMECAQRFDAPPPTDADIRVVYDRWLKEAACLRDLGFEPDPPPPFAEFLDTYRTTGPWMPIDGVDEQRLPAEATDQCGLEMID